MEQEQLYAAVIVIGVIFSILTNVALYYYGEAKDLKRKVNQGEYLYVRGGTVSWSLVWNMGNLGILSTVDLVSIT